MLIFWTLQHWDIYLHHTGQTNKTYSRMINLFHQKALWNLVLQVNIIHFSLSRYIKKLSRKSNISLSWETLINVALAMMEDVVLWYKTGNVLKHLILLEIVWSSLDAQNGDFRGRILLSYYFRLNVYMHTQTCTPRHASLPVLLLLF